MVVNPFPDYVKWREQSRRLPGEVNEEKEEDPEAGNELSAEARANAFKLRNANILGRDLPQISWNDIQIYDRGGETALGSTIGGTRSAAAEAAILGQGSFGVVVRAVLRRHVRPEEQAVFGAPYVYENVAVKVLTQAKM
jgi:hypothetical protein